MDGKISSAQKYELENKYKWIYIINPANRRKEKRLQT